jgi:hypothetical protein
MLVENIKFGALVMSRLQFVRMRELSANRDARFQVSWPTRWPWSMRFSGAVLSCRGYVASMKSRCPRSRGQRSFMRFRDGEIGLAGWKDWIRTRPLSSGISLRFGAADTAKVKLAAALGCKGLTNSCPTCSVPFHTQSLCLPRKGACQPTCACGESKQTLQINFASNVIAALRTFETGQFFSASRAIRANAASSRFGT